MSYKWGIIWEFCPDVTSFAQAAQVNSTWNREIQPFLTQEHSHWKTLMKCRGLSHDLLINQTEKYSLYIPNFQKYLWCHFQQTAIRRLVYTLRTSFILSRVSKDQFRLLTKLQGIICKKGLRFGRIDALGEYHCKYHRQDDCLLIHSDKNGTVLAWEPQSTKATVRVDFPILSCLEAIAQDLQHCDVNISPKRDSFLVCEGSCHVRQLQAYLRVDKILPWLTRHKLEISRNEQIHGISLRQQAFLEA